MIPKDDIWVNHQEWCAEMAIQDSLAKQQTLREQQDPKRLRLDQIAREIGDGARPKSLAESRLPTTPNRCRIGSQNDPGTPKRPGSC